MPAEKVAICVPVRVAPPGVWFAHFNEFLNHLNEIGQPYKLFPLHDPTNNISIIRETLAERVLEDGTCPWMLWFDDDVFFPMNVLELFFETGKKACSGIYWNRHNNVAAPLLQKFPDKQAAYPYWGFETETLFPIHAAGFGCFFINVEVFNHLIRPWFDVVMAGMGEDIFFCYRLSATPQVVELGYELYAEAKAVCKHLVMTDGVPSYLPDEETWRIVNEFYA